MMKQHKARRPVEFVPYHARRSESALKYEDNGSSVTVRMEVASLGTLVITTTAKFSTLEKIFKWNQTAELSARIES